MTNVLDDKLTDKTAIIVAAIQELTSFEEIDFVFHALRMRRDYMGQIAKELLEVGMLVRFFHKNIPKDGLITKINQKKVKIDIDGVVWTVPPSMLMPVRGELG
ncbi:hypothetical protein LCGC14_0740430 [marine sediment metagenome]|uniref:Uncharacterized protein n=1 Tax=marine sediment metagenome TaxID=412755 RepID=A0A0F9QB43_9ZZZZ